MSKYNDYAKKQNALFIEARTIYNDAFNALEKAKSEYKTAMSLQPFQEKRIGDNERLRTQCRIKMEQAQADFDRVKDTVWNDYNLEVDRLSVQLERQIRKDGQLDPDQLDSNAISLIDSGVLDVDDYRGLIEKYDSSPSMLKYISKVLSIKAEETENKEERRELLSLSREVSDGRSAVKRQWDDLVQAGKIYSGQNHSKTEPAVIASLSNKWDSDESGISDVISNF